jgi:hypothetical protein
MGRLNTCTVEALPAIIIISKRRYNIPVSQCNEKLSMKSQLANMVAVCVIQVKPRPGQTYP